VVDRLVAPGARRHRRWPGQAEVPPGGRAERGLRATVPRGRRLWTLRRRSG